jgi:hypothetical protein
MFAWVLSCPTLKPRGYVDLLSKSNMRAAYSFDAERRTKQTLSWAYEKVRRIFRSSLVWAGVESLARALQERRILTFDEAVAIAEEAVLASSAASMLFPLDLSLPHDPSPRIHWKWR